MSKDITQNQFEIIEIIKKLSKEKNRPILVSELNEHLKKPFPTTLSMVNRLASKGILTKSKSGITIN